MNTPICSKGKWLDGTMMFSLWKLGSPRRGRNITRNITIGQMSYNVLLKNENM